MDDFLGEVTNAIAKMTSGIGKVSNDIVAQTKLSYEIVNTKNEIEKRQLEIGALFCAAKNGNPVPEGRITTLTQEVDELTAKLNELRVKEIEIKGRKFCPSCSAVVTPTDAFCSKCGKQLSSDI